MHANLTIFTKIRHFSRLDYLGAFEIKIQIIATESTPIQIILGDFYTTAIVNLLSWNKAYAVFPLPAFVHHKSYMLEELNSRLAKKVNKYTRRGWRFQGTPWPEEEQQVNHPIRSTRRIGDKYTWVIPFEISNVQLPRTPDSVIEYAQFGFTIERNLRHPPPREYPKNTSQSTGSSVPCLGT